MTRRAEASVVQPAEDITGATSSTKNSPVPSGPAEQSAAAHFSTFFRSTYQQFVRFALYAGAPRGQAEDLVQQAMLELFTNWHQVAQPETWVRRAIVSNWVKIKRRDAERAARTVAGGYATPLAYNDEAIVVWEDERWVRQLLGRLPPNQREVMALVLMCFTPAEAAVVLGKSPEAVRQNLRLARDRLAKELNRERVRLKGRSAGPPVGADCTREEAP